MSFESLLNHRVDIYHIVKSDLSPGYGLPSSPFFVYSETPDIENVPCHFSVNNSTVVVVQKTPQSDYEASIKLDLPVDTDVRVNDKIIDCDTGYEYTAGIPRNIRGHHVSVRVLRTKTQEPL